MKTLFFKVTVARHCSMRIYHGILPGHRACWGAEVGYQYLPLNLGSLQVSEALVVAIHGHEVSSGRQGRAGGHHPLGPGADLGGPRETEVA